MNVLEAYCNWFWFSVQSLLKLNTHFCNQNRWIVDFAAQYLSADGVRRQIAIRTECSLRVFNEFAIEKLTDISIS